MNKRMKVMTIALVVVFGGIIGFNAFKSFMIKRFFATFEPPPVSVSSVIALKKTWQPHINAVGNFVAINGVEVNSEASGSVVGIHFDSGQYVAKDAPLIDIDDSVDQATLKFDQADQTLKEINYQRQDNLLKKGAASTSNVDEAKANLQQAQANVEKTVAHIKQKHIAAPFAGRAGIRQVNLGQYITPGQTSIVTLQSLDPLFLQFNLPEQLFNVVHLGQKVRFSVEEFPNTLFEGEITAINSKIDPNTHNILIQATFPNCATAALKNPEKSDLIKIRQDPETNKRIIRCDTAANSKQKIDSFIFIPGMFAAIAVEQPPIPDVIVLPSTAISYSLYGDSVFVIKKGKKNSKGKETLVVERVFITAGDQEGNNTVIKKGITAGQMVVSSGELKLQNGASVVINNDVVLNVESDPSRLDQ